MKDLARILAAYIDIDAELEQERDGALLPAQVEARQILNDQAYFLLCWGQLENEINTACRAAIRRRQSDADWRTRRGWDLYNPEDPRLSGLSFDSRVRLVLDGQAGRGSAFAMTMSHYAMRNKVAHGKLEARRLNLPVTVAEFHLIQAALHRAT